MCRHSESKVREGMAHCSQERSELSGGPTDPGWGRSRPRPDCSRPAHCEMKGDRAVLSIHSSPGKALPPRQPLVSAFLEWT